MIEPGDAIFVNTQSEWVRYRLSTDELVELNWEVSSIFANRTAFDIDGHLLMAFRTRLIKLDPSTGHSSLVSPPAAYLNTFAITNEGDYVVGDLQSTIRKFGRGNNELLWTASLSQGGGPYDLVVRGDTVYSTFFPGLWRTDVETGLSEIMVDSLEFSSDFFPRWVASRSDGMLVVANANAGANVYQYDIATHEIDEIITPDSCDCRIQDIEIDGDDRLWLWTDKGVFIHDFETSDLVSIASLDSQVGTNITIVPADWTPPVPEPASLALLLLGVAVHCGRRS